MAQTTHPTSAMTGYSSPSPYVVYDDYSANTSRTWKLYDKDDNTTGDFYTWSAYDLTNNAFVTLDVGAANAGYLVSYRVKKVNEGYVENINAWKLFGSNDNSNWTELDSRSGISLDSDTTYTLNCATSYRYYRFRNFHNTNSDAAGENSFARTIEFTIDSSPPSSSKWHLLQMRNEVAYHTGLQSR